MLVELKVLSSHPVVVVLRPHWRVALHCPSPVAGVWGPLKGSYKQYRGYIGRCRVQGSEGFRQGSRYMNTRVVGAKTFQTLGAGTRNTTVWVLGPNLDLGGTWPQRSHGQI